MSCAGQRPGSIKCPSDLQCNSIIEEGIKFTEWQHCLFDWKTEIVHSVNKVILWPRYCFYSL